MRNKLLMAACAVALMGAPALAQESQPPVNDPIDPPSNTTDDQPPATTPADPLPPVPRDVVAPSPPAATPDATAETPPEVLAETDVTEAPDGNIVEVLRAEGNFTTLLQALESTGLDDVLASDDSISILAPTDEAFAALPETERQRLMDPANRDELQQLLLYHVINADVRREQIEDRRGAVETGSGAMIMLDGGGGSLRADAATITSTDLRGANGAVLVLDQVLNPATSLAGMGDVDDTTTATDDAADATTEAPADTVDDMAEQDATMEQPATTLEAPVETMADPAVTPPATTDPAVTDAGDDEATPPTTDDEGAPMPTTPPTDTEPEDPVVPGDEDPTTPDPQ